MSNLKVEMKELGELLVFPSLESTISVKEDPIYGGAHEYKIRECLGFNDGKTEYVNSTQTIKFIHKPDNAPMEVGLQSEQLVLMLIDRHEKLNSRFPSDLNETMIKGLKMFIGACHDRVQERMDRGVMGQLKK